MMILGDTFALSHAEFAVPERFDYIYDPAEAMESFRAVEQQFLFCGHTHFPGTIRLLPDGHPDYRKPADFKMEEGFRYLVNVGSVGDPRNGDTRASYVIYDLDEESVAFRNVPFDIEAYRLDIEWAGIPTKPVLFDYADALTPVEAVTQVREFHVDEDAVARATAAEDAVGLQRIDSSGLQSRRKLVVNAGTMGDEISFRSSSAGRYQKSDRKRLAVTLGICLGSLLIIGIALAWSDQKAEAEMAAAQNEAEKVEAKKRQGELAAEMAAKKVAAEAAAEMAAKKVAAEAAAEALAEMETKKAPAASIQSLLPWGSDWAYLDDGSNQGRAWRAPGFDHSSWKSGPAELGYGENDQATVVGFIDRANDDYYEGDSWVDLKHDDKKEKIKKIKKNATTYFRTTFRVDNAAALENLTIRLLRDDAAAIYLNGLEVYRDENLPEDAGFATLATENVDKGSDEDEEVLYPIGLGFLLNGTNTIAVEVHQRSRDSTDIAFNLELRADVREVPQPGAGPGVHPEIVASTRQELDLLMEKILDRKVDPAEAIPPLREMAKNVAGTSLETHINQVIKVYDVQITNMTRDFKAMYTNLLETVVGDLLAGRIGDVIKARSDMTNEWPDIATTLEFKRLARDVDQLREARDVILATFQLGGTVQLAPRKGKKVSVRVVAIKEDAIMVKYLENGAPTKVPFELPVHMLSPPEQLSRLREAEASVADFYKEILIAALPDRKNTPEAPNPKESKVLAKAIAGVMLERQEATLIARMLKLQEHLMVPADLIDPTKIRERIFARPLSPGLMNYCRTYAEETRERFDHLHAFKQHEPFIEVLEDMWVPEDIRPSVGALGVMSMASNKIKQMGKNSWGMRSEGLKKNVGVIHGNHGKPKPKVGEGGSLFAFTGKNHISFEDGIGVKGNSDWTLTFWARPEKKTGKAIMVCLGGGKNVNTSFRVGIENDKWWFGPHNKLQSHSEVKRGQWQFHEIAHKGSKTTWTIDTKLKDQIDEQVLNIDEFMILGALKKEKGKFEHEFRGCLKDVHIYKAILGENIQRALHSKLKTILPSP
jgi:diadenosine tetraphosphatase ApaH/serine/threonine PP2A family protein phosphatase